MDTTEILCDGDGTWSTTNKDKNTGFSACLVGDSVAQNLPDTLSCVPLMKMNAFVLCLIWGFQWRCTKLESDPDQLTSQAPCGKPIPWLSTPVSGCGQKALGHAWRCVGRVNRRQCILFSVCQLSSNASHRQLRLKNADCINAASTDFAVGNTQCCCLWSTMFLCHVIFSFFYCCTALFSFNFRSFLWPSLSGRKINGLSGSKHRYLFQSTCLQTWWCALGWLYLG